jgi:hypothetical protein
MPYLRANTRNANINAWIGKEKPRPLHRSSQLLAAFQTDGCTVPNMLASMPEQDESPSAP